MRKTALIALLACSVLQAILWGGEDGDAGAVKLKKFTATQYKYPATRDWVAELRAGAFLPTSQSIQKRFTSGWIEGEAEFTYRFSGHFGVWGNAGYSKRQGHHKAVIQLIPVSAGLKYLFLLHHVRPYVGIGPCYTFTHLKNYSPLTRKRSYKNRFGFVAKSGVYIDLPRHWTLDLFLDYYSQKVHFQRAKKADVSGFRTGIGLGYKF